MAQEKMNQLSLRDAGQFDKKFRMVDVRVPVTAWERLSRDRAARGVSRSARITAKKAGGSCGDTE